MKVCLAIILILAIGMVACDMTTTVAPMQGDLRVITEVYPPFNFIDKNHDITGQSTEIVQAIMQETGDQATIEIMNLSDGIAIAEKGPNVIIYSLNRTPQREKLFKWVGPIGNYEQAFYAKKGSSLQISSLENAMAVEKVGVYRGDAGAQFLESHGFKNLDESLTDAEALRKLVNNEVQLWLGNKDGLAITADEADVNPDDLVLMSAVVIRADLYIAFSKDIPDSVVNAWQVALDKLKTETDMDDKTVYQKILSEYNDPAYIDFLLHGE